MKRKQFTLIEMLVVIAIIAVLATMIGSAVFGVKEKGNRTACLNNLKQLYTALNTYRDAQGGFPFIDASTHTASGGEAHVKLLKKIRVTEAGNNPNLYICPSASNVVAGEDASDDDLKTARTEAPGNVASFFKSNNNSYAYFMGDSTKLESGTTMRTTSGILADGFRGAAPQKANGSSEEGWNHKGAGNFVRVDSSGVQKEDENWPDQVKGTPAEDWAVFKL